MWLYGNNREERLKGDIGALSPCLGMQIQKNRLFVLVTSLVEHVAGLYV